MLACSHGCSTFCAERLCEAPVLVKSAPQGAVTAVTLMCPWHPQTQVSRTGRSLWARNGTPAGAPGATGSVARGPRAAGGGEAELLPLDRWLCRGEVPGPAPSTGLSPALSSDAACAPAGKDQVAPGFGHCPDLLVLQFPFSFCVAACAAAADNCKYFETLRVA